VISHTAGGKHSYRPSETEDFDFNLLTQEIGPSKGQSPEKQKRGEEKTKVQA